MADPVILGETSPLEQPKELKWDPDTGWSEGIAYEGPVAQIEALRLSEKEAPTQVWSGIDCRHGQVESRIVFWKAEGGTTGATDATTVSLISSRWELDRSVIRKPLRQHYYFDDPGQYPYLDYLDKLLAKGTSPDWDNDNNLAGANGRTVAYYYYRITGTQGFNFTTYVARRIDVYNGNPSDIISPANENAIVNLPSDIPVYMQDIATHYEWLQQVADCKPAGRGNYELSREYWGGTPTWAVFYGGSWNPVPPGTTIPNPGG